MDASTENAERSPVVLPEEVPSGPSWLERYQTVLIAIAIIIVSIVVVALRTYQVTGMTSDEAFAPLRYAAHAANGEGVVWNRGEHPATEGYANILWIIYLVIPFRMGFDPFTWIRITNVAALITCGLVLLVAVARMTREWLSPQTAFLCGAMTFAFLLLHAAAPVAAASGLETSVSGLLLLLALLAIGRSVTARRPFVSAVAGALAVLCFLLRLEQTLVLAAAFAVVSAASADRRHFVRFMIYPALVAFLLYDIWRTWHAWMVLPLPLHAQFGQQTRLLEGLDATVGFLGSVAPLLLCALPIAWLGFTQRRSFLPAVAAFAVLLLLSAVTPPGGADLHRLPLPFLPTIMLGAGLGLAWMLRRIPTGWITPAVLLLLLSYFLWQTDRFAFVRPMAIERGRLVRNGLVLLGRALADVDSSGGSTVALGGFAATAYYSGWRVIDTHGTHDPAIALATTKGMYDPALVLKDQPELLITSSRRPKVFDAVGPMDSLLTNSAMRSGYRRLGAVRVTDSLYLWLFSSEAANARTIVAAVERRTAPLLH